MGVLFVMALGVEAATGWMGIRGHGSLAALGAHFDGHLYIEIARSFPLPYAAEGRDYLGQPPGYPVLIALGRLVAPEPANWGLLALLASWIPGALCAPAFYSLCRQTGSRAFEAGILFAVVNPRWVQIAATGHSEPLACLLAIACLIAYFRNAPGWSAVCLSLAVLTRFPSLVLGIPLAYGVVVQRRGWTFRNLVILSTPIVALALLHLYLTLRIPDFPGIFATHRVFWNTSFAWPFGELATALVQGPRRGLLVPFLITYALLAAYILSVGIGLRPSERRLWILPVWVASIVVLHASLSGPIGARAFARLTILAYPAALLIWWRWLERRLSVRAVAIVCVCACAFSIRFAAVQIRGAVRLQASRQPFLAETIDRLESDQPFWIDFRKMRAEQRARDER